MLSPERLAEIKRKLEGLSPEEQQEKLKELLTPEEMQGLQKQQCPFCMIAEGKIDAVKVYEDDFFIAALEIHPAAEGHVILFPKEHIPLLALMDDKHVGKMFVIANKIAKAIFDGLKVEGTNIFVANGHFAGQVIDHVSVHIIPRHKGDKIQFGWEGLKVEKGELEKIAEKIMVPKEEMAEEPKEENKEEEEEFEIEERIP